MNAEVSYLSEWYDQGLKGDGGGNQKGKIYVKYFCCHCIAQEGLGYKQAINMKIYVLNIQLFPYRAMQCNQTPTIPLL